MGIRAESLPRGSYKYIDHQVVCLPIGSHLRLKSPRQDAVFASLFLDRCLLKLRKPLS